MGANISTIPPYLNEINCELKVGPFSKNSSLSQLLDGYKAVEDTPGGWRDLKNWSPNVEADDFYGLHNSESLMSAITMRMEQYSYHSGASFGGLMSFLRYVAKNGVDPKYLKKNAWRWIFGRYYLGRFPEIMGVLAIIAIARRFLRRTS